MHSRMKGALLMAVLAMLAMSATAEGQRSTSARRGKAAQGRRSPNERTTGFMLGVHTIAAPGLTLTSAEFDPGYRTNFGLGAGATVGYGFNRTFSAYASLDVAKQNANTAVEGTFGLAHFEVGVRANFPNVSLGSPNTVPYLMGSLGRRGLAAHVIDLEDDEEGVISFSGGMIGLGAGIEHFFSPNMSFDAGLHLGFGTFNTFKVDNETMDYGASATTSVRLRLGVTWRP